MLLDERLPESHGDAIAVLRAGDRARPALLRARALLLAPLLVGLVIAWPNTPHAQQTAPSERRLAAFASEYPDVDALLTAAERAHGVLYGALAAKKGKVKETEVYGALTRRVAVGAVNPRLDPEAAAGYGVLGTRGAEIIRRTQAFHREVLAIFATLDAADRVRALDAAVDQYLSRPEVSLPDTPKDMTILYDHPYTSVVFDPNAFPTPGPVRKAAYPSLTGFAWATYWLQLAAQEPLALSADAEARREGLTVVTERFRRKLSFGKPPDAFPTELPLAPSIAPEFITVHLRAAAILDNLNMMHAVLADVLVHPEVGNLRAALDQVIVLFTDRRERVVDVDDWIRMALRHSIFEQGGPALGVMTTTDRNSSGHLQHFGGGRGILPGMR